MKLNFEYTPNKELGHGALEEMQDVYSFSAWKNELAEAKKKKMKEKEDMDVADDVEDDSADKEEYNKQFVKDIIDTAKGNFR